MKKCFKCNTEKPITEFYKHPQMSDGYLGKCKECTKKDSLAKYEEYKQDPAWASKNRVRMKKLYHKYYSPFRNAPRPRPLTFTERSIIFRKNNPEKYHAHNILNNALKLGKIEKQSCEECGGIKTHAHHEDYSKPLEVIWLCIKHHNRRHLKKLLVGL